MSTPVPTRTGPNFGRQGAIILSVFALIWALAGASGIDGGSAFWGIAVVALAITAGTIVFAVRSAPKRHDPRQLAPDWQRRYNIVGIGQGLAILVAIVVFVAIDQPGLIPPVVCFIVGIHFLPLASTFDQQEYLGTALALCGIAIIGMVMLNVTGDETVRAVVGFGAAIALWGTALAVARTG